MPGFLTLPKKIIKLLISCYICSNVRVQLSQSHKYQNSFNVSTSFQSKRADSSVYVCVRMCRQRTGKRRTRWRAQRLWSWSLWTIPTSKTRSTTRPAPSRFLQISTKAVSTPGHVLTLHQATPTEVALLASSCGFK